MVSWKSCLVSPLVSRNIWIVRTQLPPWNVYRTSVPLQKKSVEHIIPKRLFPDKKESFDIHNLVMCELAWNHRRSDFRYGKGTTKTIVETEFGALFPEQRIFQPHRDADLGLIGRSIVRMLYDYPYLYRSLDQIIADPCLLDEWSSLPCLSFERERNRWLE